MKRFVLLTAYLLLASPVFASQADVYIAGTAAGADTGASCATAHAASWFNDATKWGTGATQIGVTTNDTIVHLCGTFTDSNRLRWQGSGTAGHVIKMVFEAGAKFSAATFTDDMIGSQGLATRSYIEIDGIGAGIMEATANGSPGDYANANQFAAVYFSTGGCNHCRVHNLTIGPLYVHSRSSDTTHDYGQGINLGESSDSRVDNNIVHDCYIGIPWIWNGGVSNAEVDHNTIYNINWGMYFASTASAVSATTILLHDNDISEWAIWEDDSDNFHHNGIFVTLQSGPTITGLQIYNNYFHGDVASHMTGMLFMEVGSGAYTSPLIYNNIFYVTAGNPSNGMLSMGDSDVNAPKFYNNTWAYASNTGGTCWNMLGPTDAEAINNVFINCGQHHYYPSGDLTTSNYNSYFGGTYYGPGAGSNTTLAAWKTAAAVAETSTLTVDPGLSTFVPSTGSSIYHAGQDLSGLGITALNTSKNGVARGSGGSWTMGANDVPGGSCTPSKVVFSAQPGSVALGVSLGTISVAIQDSGSNTCTSDTSTVTLAKTGGTCTGMTLNGTVSGAAVAGVFTTTNVNMTVATGACTLTASASGLTDAISSSFTISAGAVAGNGRDRMHR